MSPSRSFLQVIPHFSGVPKVSGPFNVKVGSSELEPPEALDIPPAALLTVNPGDLLVVKDEQEPNRPLVLASYGKKADLGGSQDLIERAQEIGRAVEIHVFDEPGAG